MLMYFILISLLSIIVTIIDKINSINRKWRVSERSLLLLAIIGGAVAMYSVMRIIRHKTLHNKFMLGLPIIIILQIILIVFYAINFNIF